METRVCTSYPPLRLVHTYGASTRKSTCEPERRKPHTGNVRWLRLCLRRSGSHVLFLVFVLRPALLLASYVWTSLQSFCTLNFVLWITATQREGGTAIGWTSVARPSRIDRETESNGLPVTTLLETPPTITTWPLGIADMSDDSICHTFWFLFGKRQHILDFVPTEFWRSSLSINVITARLCLLVFASGNWHLNSFRAPTLWFTDLTVATCLIQYTFLSLCQIASLRKRTTQSRRAEH